MVANAVSIPKTLAPEVADFCQRVVGVLREKMPVREVWLFGSQVSGKATEDSDVDLLVVLTDDHGMRRPTLECRNALNHLKDRQPMDLIALNESAWRDENVRKFSIYGEVAEEGVRLL